MSNAILILLAIVAIVFAIVTDASDDEICIKQSTAKFKLSSDTLFFTAEDCKNASITHRFRYTGA